MDDLGTRGDIMLKWTLKLDVCLLLNLIQERNRQMLNGNRSLVSLVCGMSLGHMSSSLFRRGCALWS